MSNIVTQYIRRISKYLTNVDDNPTVAPSGTNHVDDASLWGNTTIYKGETVVNLATGKSYTSDDAQIIEIGVSNAIIYGMQVVSVPAASNNANNLWLKVTDGYVRINGRLLKHQSVATDMQSNGDIIITANTTLQPRFDLIYAYNGYPDKINSNDTDYKAKLQVITGSSNLQDLYSQDYVDTKLSQASPTLTKDNSIFLGFVYVPANYTVSSFENLLRPWSYGVSSEGTGENLLNFNHAQSLNAQVTSPGGLLSIILSTIATHYEA
jgi:hypothetical protein